MRGACALAVAALGFAPPGPLRADQPVGPRLVVEPAGFDFGRVLQHRALRTEFRVRNFGDGPLVLSALHTDCDCAAVLLEADARRLAPGQSATLEVRLETRRSLGRIVRHVRIESNDAKQPTHELWLAADVRARR